MIKINEIRIGSYIKDSAGIKQIKNTDQLVRVIEELMTSKPRVKPVILDEDILLKCGFECYEFDNGQLNQYRFKNRLIVIRDGKFVDYGCDVVITSLHQLQNLYFALTGEELNINL